jgi:hypothetical protein
VIKQLVRPRAILPMGFALGLVVLWELGVVPVPFEPGAGPIARAAIAILLAVFGALVAFAVQLAISKLFRRPKAPTRDGES